MTPPDDRSGQYGVPYPGTGHDAFGAPGVGPGQQYGRPQPHGQEYGQQPYGQAQHPYGQPTEQYGQYSRHGRHGQYAQPQPSFDAPPPGYPVPPADPGAAPGHRRDQEPGHVEEFEDEPDAGPLIRPFAMTGGRTRPRYELALEALVSADVDPQRLATLLPEHQRICTLCTEVKSVAEVSALLSLPLGVARILVADLAEAGLVAIHQPASGGESGNQPDVTLLERVLSGLRKL
ncbi:DUF742 domain-containing protein [Kitasatospora aureofaciens]|uniref:DUF742 domain-containing protein n=1 Tax=Kitasatospora aureofaciens TaxID=1894 RepID=UPI001C44D987|nr:DUF742 domain-containing protein [Kitasatospora aureofaciens]MBV6703531.1 DUF742 domain-containing protein [Kitasatospora aureofaciens]